MIGLPLNYIELSFSVSLATEGGGARWRSGFASGW